jgi:hypothetical protein
MKLAALAAAALLVPPVAAAPPRPPQIVSVSVGHDRATGFVAGDERVVTVAHVLSGADGVVPGDEAVAGADSVVVDGRPASVVRLDHRLDLAVLRVEGLRGEAVRVGGGDTSLLGRPAPVVRRIKARLDGGPPRPALEIRATVAIGQSGAPLVTDTGRVAGVVFARSRHRSQTAYAVDGAALAGLLR